MKDLKDLTREDSEEDEALLESKRKRSPTLPPPIHGTGRVSLSQLQCLKLFLFTMDIYTLWIFVWLSSFSTDTTSTRRGAPGGEYWKCRCISTITESFGWTRGAFCLC